jgi:hypothetical protein
LYFDPPKTRAAIVTCGGLCPGLNSVIRSAFLEFHHNYGVREVLGIRHGFQGLTAKAPPPLLLTPELVDHIHRDGRIYTQLCIADNGPGLPGDVMVSLFRPLGRTRRAGHSGLGLSIVHNLVARLGGEIACQSQPGRGTRFFILLPQQRADVGTATPAQRLVSPPAAP